MNTGFTVCLGIRDGMCTWHKGLPSYCTLEEDVTGVHTGSQLA